MKIICNENTSSRNAIHYQLQQPALKNTDRESKSRKVGGKNFIKFSWAKQAATFPCHPPIHPPWKSRPLCMSQGGWKKMCSNWEQQKIPLKNPSWLTHTHTHTHGLIIPHTHLTSFKFYANSKPPPLELQSQTKRWPLASRGLSAGGKKTWKAPRTDKWWNLIILLLNWFNWQPARKWG